MEKSLAAIMTEFPLLRGFTAEGTQRLLERGEIKEYRAGEILFSQNDPAESVLLVIAGKTEVFAEREGGEMVLTEAGPGTILGELAVLCGIPRSASVRASENATALLWSASVFRNLLLRHPLLSERIFKQSLRTLVEKERSLIDSVLALQSGRPPK
jgi:CRP-like cAMP-binding protein